MVLRQRCGAVAAMGRYEISAMAAHEDFLPCREGHLRVTVRDNRGFVDGVLRVLRSEAQWKDLPEEYSNLKSVHKRSTRRTRSGIWERIFQILLEGPDNRYGMIDYTIVRAHLLS